MYNIYTPSYRDGCSCGINAVQMMFISTYHVLCKTVFNLIVKCDGITVGECVVHIELTVHFVTFSIDSHLLLRMIIVLTCETCESWRFN